MCVAPILQRAVAFTFFDGAYAALLGLHLHETEEGRRGWETLAVGDCGAIYRIDDPTVGRGRLIVRALLFAQDNMIRIFCSNCAGNKAVDQLVGLGDQRPIGLAANLAAPELLGGHAPAFLCKLAGEGQKL